VNWLDILNRYSNEMLAAMCTALRVSQYAGQVTRANRVAAMRALQKALSREGHVDYALKFMGAVEMTALKLLLQHGGQEDLEVLRNSVLVQGATMKPTRLADHSRWQEATPDYQGVPHFEDALARAACFGLIFSRDIQHGDLISFTPGKTLFIPSALMDVLDGHAEFAAREANAADAPPQVMRASAFDFQRDLSRYWRHAHKQGEVALTTQGWIYKANFKTFLSALNLPTDVANDESSNARMYFMRRLLVAMGEFDGDNFAGFLYATQESKLLAQPMAERIKNTFETWQHTGAWNELNRLPVDHFGIDHRREAPPELAGAREAILRSIVRLAVGHPQEWVRVDSLIGQIRRKDYQFLFKRNEKRYFGENIYMYPSRTYGVSFTGIRDDASGWVRVEQAFIINVLTGPLAWLGAVELGYGKEQQTGENTVPQSFRLTEVGAWLLGLADMPEFAEVGGRVVVQPNFVILAMEPINDQVLVDLDRFADASSGERVTSYEMTRASVYRGQRQGWHAAEILAFLEQHQGMPVASNVRRTLEEWELQHRRITFRRNQVVVQFADAETQHETRELLGEYQARSLTEQFDVLGKPDAKQVIHALHEAGWSPLTENANKAQSEAAVSYIKMKADGELTLTQPTPSVFVLGQLAQFASANSDGTWAITAESVQRAIGRGLTVEQVLTLIMELSQSAVPLALERRIRKWSGFFGQANLQNVLLLELESVDALTALMADEELKAYLQPIEGSSKPLALVSGIDLPNLREMLIERGVRF